MAGGEENPGPIPKDKGRRGKPLVQPAIVNRPEYLSCPDFCPELHALAVALKPRMVGGKRVVPVEYVCPCCKLNGSLVRRGARPGFDHVPVARAVPLTGSRDLVEAPSQPDAAELEAPELEEAPELPPAPALVNGGEPGVATVPGTAASHAALTARALEDVASMGLDVLPDAHVVDMSAVEVPPPTSESQPRSDETAPALPQGPATPPAETASPSARNPPSTKSPTTPPGKPPGGGGGTPPNDIKPSKLVSKGPDVPNRRILEGRFLQESEHAKFADFIGVERGSLKVVNLVRDFGADDLRHVALRPMSVVKWAYAMQVITGYSRTVTAPVLTAMVLLFTAVATTGMLASDPLSRVAVLAAAVAASALAGTGMYLFGRLALLARVRFKWLLGSHADARENARFFYVAFTTLAAVVQLTAGASFYQRLPLWPALTFHIALAVIATLAAVFGFRTKVREVEYLVIPHYVTGALAEYSNRVDAATVDANTRQKLLRQCAVPVPDADYAQALSGSEEMVRFVCATEHFFVPRPARWEGLKAWEPSVASGAR